MRRNPKVALLDMLIAARRAHERVSGLSLDEFLESEDAQWLAWSQIVILGEAANRVPQEDQDALPAIPWRLAIGMRNRVVHGYDAIDWEVVFETVSTDLPDLIALLEANVGPESS